MAEALGIYYKDIGVETEIEVLDWAKVREMFRKKAIQCCIWPNIISWRPSEEWIRTSYYSKSPNHHYENEFIDKHYDALTKAVNPQERQQHRAGDRRPPVRGVRRHPALLVRQRGRRQPEGGGRVGLPGPGGRPVDALPPREAREVEPAIAREAARPRLEASTPRPARAHAQTDRRRHPGGRGPPHLLLHPLGRREGGGRRELLAAPGRDARHRRRVGLRQDHDRAVAAAAGAAAGRPHRQGRHPARGREPRSTRASARCAQHPRAPHLDDPAGPADLAQPGVHRSATSSSRRIEIHHQRRPPLAGAAGDRRPQAGARGRARAARAATTRTR